MHDPAHHVTRRYLAVATPHQSAYISAHCVVARSGYVHVHVHQTDGTDHAHSAQDTEQAHVKIRLPRPAYPHIADDVAVAFECRLVTSIRKRFFPFSGIAPAYRRPVPYVRQIHVIQQLVAFAAGRAGRALVEGRKCLVIGVQVRSAHPEPAPASQVIA